MDSASVIKLVRPIWQSVLHGKTQNQNESFNSMIWERVPKITYVGKDILDFAVYDAAANFNDGRQGYNRPIKSNLISALVIILLSVVIC